MLKTIVVLGGESVVNVVAEKNGMILANSGTFFTIYGIEWQGKRNVQHVGEWKYIQRLWNKRYNNNTVPINEMYRSINCVPRQKLQNEYIPE